MQVIEIFPKGASETDREEGKQIARHVYTSEFDTGSAVVEPMDGKEEDKLSVVVDCISDERRVQFLRALHRELIRRFGARFDIVVKTREHTGIELIHRHVTAA